MALTEERIEVPTPPTPDLRTEPDAEVRTPGWGWALVALGAAIAIVLAVVVLQAGDGTDDGAVTGDHQLLVENGSPRAVDAAAAASAVGVGDHGLIVQYGSIAAIDHAADAGLPVAGPPTDNNGLIEHGSIRAVDHAAEASGS